MNIEFGKAISLNEKFVFGGVDVHLHLFKCRTQTRARHLVHHILKECHEYVMRADADLINDGYV